VRLDLFLKTARLIKRRTIARELCDHGRVLVNGRVARSAKEVKPGDGVTLLFSARSVEIEILAIPGPQRETGLVEPYRVIRETRFVKKDDA
jgi:ribosomal 50S subunit-recycling heat shock protein